MRRLAAALLALTILFTVDACAPVDDSIGSRLSQPPVAAGAPPRQAEDGGDIAIVGQIVSHAIMELPVVANAAVPPLVQFNGVTSIVDKPIDTEPYTDLLRDRLLLLTREKLRFFEHTLPPLIPVKKSHDSTADNAPSSPDYEILAELRGHADSDSLKVQVQFVDIHTNEVLFDGLYKIRREADTDVTGMPPNQPGANDAPPVPPTTSMPPPAGSGIQ